MINTQAARLTGFERALACGAIAGPIVGAGVMALAGNGNMPTVVGVIFVGAGIVCGAFLGRRHRRWLLLHIAVVTVVSVAAFVVIADENRAGLAEHSALTTGVIVEMESPTAFLGSGTPPLYCSYTVKGTPYSRRVHIDGLRAGDTVRVRYSVSEPYVAEVTRR